MSESDLPKIKRYITAHDANGKSILSHQVSAPAVWTHNREARFFLGYCSKTFPVILSHDTDIATYQQYLSAPPGLTVSGGTVLRVVDMEPGVTSALHRTVSLDYGVALEGEVELVLDGGECIRMKRGDICVQRATNHAWRNASSTKWARMLYVLVQAAAVQVDGRVLGEDLGGMAVRKSD